MKRLGLALSFWLGLWASAFAQTTFTMPPPAGVTVVGVQVVTSCGGASLTNNNIAYLAMDLTGKLCTAASVSASITGFPTTQTTGTPISVTTGGVTGTLPTGAVVVASNVGATNGAYCKLGASATTSDQLIPPNSWFAFTVGAATQLTCITSTSTTTVNMVGGSGLPTGSGGGGGGSGGGTVAQGTAAAITSGWPVIDGAGADTTGTLTSGSGTVNATIDGYASLKAQIKGTYAGFTFTTNVSSDNGTTFVPVQCALADGTQFGTSFTLTANKSTELACGHLSGDDTFQISTASGPATGTANIDISPSSFPSMDGITVQGVIASWAGGTLGAMANYGTSPGAVLVPGVNAFVTNTNANGSAASANSSPVVIASDQAAIKTTGAINTTATDCSGTIATGGTAQNAFTAQTTLHGFTIANIDTGHNDEVLWISFTTTAAALTAASFPLPAPTATTFAGFGSFTTPPGFGLNHALSVIGATSGHIFSCSWW